MKDIYNLKNYSIFQEVEDNGQERLKCKWVVVEKDTDDPMIKKIKARLNKKF